MRIKRLLGTGQSPAVSQLAALTLFGLVLVATAVCITTAARAQVSRTLPSGIEVGSLTAGTGSPILSRDKARTPAAAPQQVLAKSILPRVPDGGPAPAQGEQTLCALKVYGNHTVSSKSVLTQILSRQGGRYDPQLVQRDMDTLMNMGSFDEVRIQRGDSDRCVQLAVYVHEKPLFREVASTSAVQPQAPESPRQVPGGIMAGQIVSRVNPVYPPEAKADHVEGAVVLKAVISTSGTVERLNAVSGPVELAPSAIDAVRQWIYKPYLLNGMPTEVETTVTINYHLEGPASDGNDQQANSTGETPKKIGNGVSAPILTHSVPPEFNEEARRKRLSGKVLVNLWVDREGNPSHIRVVRGIDKGLDEGAVAAVKQYRFKPAMEDGKPVLVELNTEVNFTIF